MSAPSIHQPLAPAHAQGIAALGRKLARNAVIVVRAWHERNRTRHRLAELDDRTLYDIGLTRAEARAESRKPFWL